VEEVVRDQQAVGGLARMVVVAAKDIDPGARATNDIADEGHVLDGRPRCAAVLVPDREDDRESRLRASPVVLEEAALDEDASSVLAPEQVCDHPGHTHEST